MTISEPLRAFSEALPTSWAIMPFRDVLAEPVRNGVYKKKEFHGSGTRVINMGELFGYDFISDQDMKRVQLTPAELSKFEAVDGDLLFARRSLVLEGAGKCSLVVTPREPAVFESSIIRARPNREVADARFLFYLFSSPLGRAIVASIATRTAVSGIRGSDLATTMLPIPPLPVQARYAAVLSAYDDLIENCQRRIKILESMARALYREWFVHFRFPGHEGHRFVDSPLGKIPEGWEVRSVKDIARVTYGFAFKSRKFNTSAVGVPVVRIRDIPPGRSETFTEETADPKYHISNGDILVGMDGDFHMCIWSGGLAYQNQRVARFEPLDDLDTTHLFLALEKPIQDFNKTITGTTVAHLGDKHIKTIQIAWPTKDLRDGAAENLNSMTAQVLGLKQRVMVLRRTRDLLLPRLLSGKIELDVA